MGKIQVGYGSDTRPKLPKNCYGTRGSGKIVMNGGFCGAPTVDYHNVTDDLWYKALPDSYRPSWDKENIDDILT